MVPDDLAYMLGRHVFLLCINETKLSLLRVALCLQLLPFPCCDTKHNIKTKDEHFWNKTTGELNREENANLSPAVFPQTCNLGLVQAGVHLVASLVGPLWRGRWPPLCFATKKKTTQKLAKITIIIKYEQRFSKRNMVSETSLHFHKKQNIKEFVVRKRKIEKKKKRYLDMYNFVFSHLCYSVVKLF